LQELSCILPALPEADITIGEKSASLLNYVHFQSQVDKVTLFADAVVKHDIEFGIAERRGDLILDNLGFNMSAYGFVALLDGLDTPEFNSRGAG
jgi:hypothetical protein